MRSCVVLSVVFAICLSGITAAPGISKRQAVPDCSVNQDCNPASLGNESIPESLVECTASGQCACSSCFMRNESSNTCYLNPPCNNYTGSPDFECQDNRRNTLTAFLLTFFLVPTGAANFYIDRLEFAIPQLILGVIYIVFQCCVMPCVRSCAKDAKENGDKAKGIISCCLCIPYCLLALLFFSWWIADLVIFGTNQRSDGDGCPLRDNL